MASEIQTVNLGFVNSYLLEVSQGFVLVDTGIRNKRDILEKALNSAGCGPGNLKLIIITHGDMDHSGNAAYLRDKFKTKIAMHRNDSQMVEEGKMMSKRRLKSFLMRMIFAIMRFTGGMQKAAARFEKFKPDIYLEDEQSLRDHGLDAKVLHLPGHTKGSLGLLTESGDLIAGDTLQNRRSPSSSTIIENEAELSSSIEKLSNLSIKTVYPGHGNPFQWEQFAASLNPQKAKESRAFHR